MSRKSSGKATLLLGVGLAFQPAVTSTPAPVTSSDGVLRLETFYSPSLGVSKRYVVYLPASYQGDPTRRFSVIYALHGATGNEADWVSRGDLHLVADSLFGQGVPEMIIVMPDGDNGYYVNWARWRGLTACTRDSLLTEAASSFCVDRANYGDYIARDLVARIDSTYRTLPDRSHRGLLGLSMGGTGALTLALTYPDVFAATVAYAAVAPPFYVGPFPFRPPARQAGSFDELDQAYGRPVPGRNRYGLDNAEWWRYDPERAARRLQQSGGPLPAIRLDVGRDDMYVDQNRALDAALTGMGIAHEYIEREGGHRWNYWRDHAGAGIAWLAERLATGPMGSRKP